MVSSFHLPAEAYKKLSPQVVYNLFLLSSGQSNDPFLCKIRPVGYIWFNRHGEWKNTSLVENGYVQVVNATTNEYVFMGYMLNKTLVKIEYNTTI